jgi:hypothetical protein
MMRCSIISVVIFRPHPQPLFTKQRGGKEELTQSTEFDRPHAYEKAAIPIKYFMEVLRDRKRDVKNRLFWYNLSILNDMPRNLNR